MLLAINSPVCPAPGSHSQRGLLTRGATYGSRSARRRNGYSAWGGNGSGQKWDFRQWGGHLAGNPLGVLPKATALTTPYLAFTFYLSWPTRTTTPTTPHLSPMHPPQPLPLTPVSPVLPPRANCLKKFVGQKRNVLRRLTCGTWTMPRHGGVTHWRKSLELLEHTLYVPIAPLFGVVPSTRSQPLPEWPVW